MRVNQSIPDKYVFDGLKTGLSNPSYWLWGGLSALLSSVVGFVSAVTSGAGEVVLHTASTLPAIIAMFALTRWWTLRGSPNAVVISQDGISLEFTTRSVTHRWEDIGWSLVDQFPSADHIQFTIFDTQGKKIARLGNSFDGFNDLVGFVKRIIKARGDDVANRICRHRARRYGALILVAAVFFVAAAVGSFYLASVIETEEQALSAEGVDGMATVVRRYVAPNGVTKRIEYEIRLDNTSGIRNTAVTDAFWNSVNVGDEVNVTYVPRNLEYSRLDVGESSRRKRSSGLMYVVGAAHCVFACLFVAGGCAQYAGYSLLQHPTTKMPRIVRFGDDRILWQDADGS